MVLYQVAGMAGGFLLREVCSISDLKPNEVTLALATIFENPEVTVCYIRKNYAGGMYHYEYTVGRSEFRNVDSAYP